MQKRTRIFTVVTLLTGLLLALGTLLAIFGPAVMDVGAKNAGHRHNHGGKKTTVIVKNGTTVTVTTTNTVTTTATPPPPPAPFCFSVPGSVVLSSGNNSQPGTFIFPGDAQFELQCQNLNASGSYELEVRFPCRKVVVVYNSQPIIFTVDGAGLGSQGVSGGGVAFGIVPDLNGRAQFTIILEGCEPGTGTMNLKDFTTLQSIVTTVALLSPRN